MGGPGDVSDLIGVAGMDKGGGFAADDPDEGLDPGARRKRMRACLSASRAWMAARPDEVAEEVGRMVAAMASQALASGKSSGPMDEAMAEEQGNSQMLYSMLITCYYSIEGELAEAVYGGAPVPKESEEELFKNVASPPRPTRRQYRLIESVFKEERDKMMKEMDSGDMPGGMGVPGRNLTTSQKTFYVLAVLAAIFGGLLWALRRSLREKPARERTAKAMRKVEKAELRLLKKAS